MVSIFNMFQFVHYQIIIPHCSSAKLRSSPTQHGHLPNVVRNCIVYSLIMSYANNCVHIYASTQSNMYSFCLIEKFMNTPIYDVHRTKRYCAFIRSTTALMVKCLLLLHRTSLTWSLLYANIGDDGKKQPALFMWG